jgi:hypothetical protein
VCINSPWTQHEALSNLGIAETLGDQAQDFDLAFCQLIEVIRLLPLFLAALALNELGSLRQT